jgi:acylphosphatase
MSAARFLVSGKVQGVWFRAATREQALALGLGGHAKNLAVVANVVRESVVAPPIHGGFATI